MNIQKAYRKARSSYHIYQEWLSPAEWQYHLLFQLCSVVVLIAVIFAVIYMCSGIQYSILLEHRQLLTLGNKNALNMIC